MCRTDELNTQSQRELVTRELCNPSQQEKGTENPSFGTHSNHHAQLVLSENPVGREGKNPGFA